MAYRQLVSPDLTPTITQPDIGVLPDWYAWCLAYVQFSFGVGWAGKTAWDTWTNRLTRKHADRNLPSGVYVPIFFSGYGGLGHAAIYKDGQVWSSPWTHKKTCDVMLSIAEVERIYHVSYVGWSEDLAGRQLVEAAPDGPAYAVTTTYNPARHLQLVRTASKWDCNRQDFEDRRSNPISTEPEGYDFWAQAVYDTHDGNLYYSPDIQNSGGYNVKDCQDYVAPTPPPLPAAPNKGTYAERYTLVATLMTFPTANDAQFATNAQTTIKPGKYYVWHKQDKLYQLGTDNVHEPVGNWVNTKFNVREVPKVEVKPPEPVKEVPVVLKPSQVKVGTADNTKWMSSYKSFHFDRHSDLYEVRQGLTMYDYSGKRKPVPVPQGQKLNMVGTFFKDGVMFYRTRSIRDEYFTWYYGVPLFDDNGAVNLVKVVETDPEKIERRISDITHYWRDDIKDIWDIILNKVKIRK